MTRTSLPKTAGRALGAALLSVSLLASTTFALVGPAGAFMVRGGGFHGGGFHGGGFHGGGFHGGGFAYRGGSMNLGPHFNAPPNFHPVGPRPFPGPHPGPRPPHPPGPGPHPPGPGPGPHPPGPRPLPPPPPHYPGYWPAPYYPGYYPGGYWAGAAVGAAVATAAIGSMVYSLPASCARVVVGGVTYEQCGDVWYQPQYYGSRVTYVVVNPPR